MGGSGDGGVDGIIKEDRLGLDAIYLQGSLTKKNIDLKDRMEKKVAQMERRIPIECFGLNYNAVIP